MKRNNRLFKIAAIQMTSFNDKKIKSGKSGKLYRESSS